MDKTLLHQARQGDFRSIARCISLIERHQTEALFADAVGVSSKSTVPVIGITGPPGAGKSTLIDGLIDEYLSQGKQIAVLCVDPSSPFHSGAVLGDRIRMSRWYENPGVFIRSLSSGGALGGIHPQTTEIVQFLSGCGFDMVLVETVGVGQSEVEIIKLATVTLLVLVPEAGDEVQFMKSGLMEAADIFVVNKSDRPGAERFAGRLRTVLHAMVRQFTHDPVVNVIAAEGKGIRQLSAMIDTFITNKNK